jgi:hypothetical protein
VRSGLLILCSLVALMCASCGIAPARPTSTASVTRPADPPDGLYRVTFHTRWLGPVTTLMAFEKTSEPTPEGARSGFKANTRPGVAWALLGGVEQVLGPVFAPFLFPSGMILTWESTMPTAASNDGTVKPGPGEGTIGIGSLSMFRVKTRLPKAGAPYEVLFKEDRLVGLITLERVGDSPPIDPETGMYAWGALERKAGKTDYSALAAAVKSGLPSMLFDQKLAESDDVKGFLTDVEAISPRAEDDVEFMFAFTAAGRKYIHFQQPLAYPTENMPEWEAMVRGREDDARPWRVTLDEKKGIATLRFDAFLSGAETEAALIAVLEKKPRGLILDLRTSPGITLAATRLASAVVDTPTGWGTLFDAAHRTQGLAGHEGGVKRVLVSDAASADEADRAMRANGEVVVDVAATDALAIRVPMAVLVSSRTSSTSEQLVGVLKRSGVRVFGERTAGRPLVAGQRDLGQGWTLRAASFDFRPSDVTGELTESKLRQGARALKPDVYCDADHADERAAEWLARQIEQMKRPIVDVISRAE